MSTFNLSRELGALEPGTSEPGALEPGTSEPGALEPGTLEPGSPENPFWLETFFLFFFFFHLNFQIAILWLLSKLADSEILHRNGDRKISNYIGKFENLLFRFLRLIDKALSNILQD